MGLAHTYVGTPVLPTGFKGRDIKQVQYTDVLAIPVLPTIFKGIDRY